jgi:hypothetical protein
MSELLIEVRPAAGVAGDLAPRVKVPEEFSRRAGEIADSVVSVAEDFRDRIEERFREHPDGTDAWQLGQVELAFAIDVQAGSGVVIARASAGATFTATLTWQRATPPRP